MFKYIIIYSAWENDRWTTYEPYLQFGINFEGAENNFLRIYPEARIYSITMASSYDEVF